MGDDLTTGSGMLTDGALVSHYRIVSKIGSGGMGEVYLADDTKLNRRVALKFLPSHLAADTTLRARFTREVQAVAALNHPNIVHVYEVSEYHNRPFFAMEYVEGEPLRERMRVAGKMPIPKALDIIIGLCEGLEAAHKVGIVHRDIKPANIVIASSGRVKILDFGLAKRASDPTLTSMGSTLGTICYMSPEQVQGKESDNRSDLFSVGIVLYEMVAGRLPFRGDYDAATLTAIVSEPHEPLLKFRPEAPPRLAAIIDRLLAKDPASRYPSVTHVLDDFEAVSDELRTGVRQAGQSARKSGFNRTILLVSASAAVVAAVALMIFSGREQETATVSQPPNPTSDNPPTVSQSEPADRPATKPADPPPQSPVVDRSQFIAESIATARESARLRALRDSIEAEQTRLLAASNAPAKPDSPATIAADRSPQVALQQHDPPPVTRTVQPPPAPVHNRAADSTAITSVLTQFWETLETGKVGNLKKLYPEIPGDWERTWGTFVEYAKDLNVTSTIGRLRFEGDEAETSNQVKMTFRDRSGQKEQNIRYSARLVRRNSQWIIENLEQN